MLKRDLRVAILIVLGFLWALNLVQSHFAQAVLKPALSAKGK